ncbi:MAG TPA: hypothetical protein VM240_08640, partial [Verrucomicrobiae bacterium]|nr:hypothetical protein [Verrucomicrobiae bacterium]
SAGYADALANLAYPFLDTASGSTVFRADLHLRQHGDEAGYDQQSGELGVRHYWGVGAWRLGTGVEGGAAWLDGESYQSTGAVVADARRVFGANTATLRYEGLHVAGEGEYVYLDGWRHRAQGLLARSVGAYRARGEVAWEINDRRDLTVGDEFSSHSPERRELGLTVSSPVLREYSLELRGRYRTSDYDEPNRFEQDGVLLKQSRGDTLIATGARLRLRKAQDWNWFADYQFSRNDSSIDAFDYARHVAAIGVEWLR